jgi:hypothetical protein
MKYIVQVVYFKLMIDQFELNRPVIMNEQCKSNVSNKTEFVNVCNKHATVKNIKILLKIQPFNFYSKTKIQTKY